MSIGGRGWSKSVGERLALEAMSEVWQSANRVLAIADLGDVLDAGQITMSSIKNISLLTI